MGPLFEDVVVEPYLLHGDLWSGNISSDKNGEPVILDPACYCKSKWVQLAYCVGTLMLEIWILEMLLVSIINSDVVGNDANILIKKFEHIFKKYHSSDWIHNNKQL